MHNIYETLYIKTGETNVTLSENCFDLFNMASCAIISSGGIAPSLVKLRIPFRSDKQNENCLSKIILVIDRSGSMAGGKI